MLAHRLSPLRPDFVRYRRSLISADACQPHAGKWRVGARYHEQNGHGVGSLDRRRFTTTLTTQEKTECSAT
jgi:hypothetical protein